MCILKAIPGLAQVVEFLFQWVWIIIESNAFRELHNKKMLKVINGMLKVEENYMIKLDSIIDFLVNH